MFGWCDSGMIQQFSYKNTIIKNKWVLWTGMNKDQKFSCKHFPRHIAAKSGRCGCMGSWRILKAFHVNWWCSVGSANYQHTSRVDSVDFVHSIPSWMFIAGFLELQAAAHPGSRLHPQGRAMWRLIKSGYATAKHMRSWRKYAFFILFFSHAS